MLAWVSEADAQAINTAGSIRMATYRINFQIATDFTADSPANLSIATEQIGLQNALQSPIKDAALASNQLNHDPLNDSIKIPVLVKDMETRLQSLREYQRAYANEHKVINEQLERIEAQWFDHLKPILLSSNKPLFYTASPQYIQDVDNFVNELQYRNEQRQTWQQLLQMASLLLTVVIMMIGMHKLRRNVLIPVQQLINANSQFKRGKRDTRLSISGYTEFKKLGDSFNEMASTIEVYQQSLESEVQLKTQHLIKANQALSLFYDFSKQLTTSPVSLHKLDTLITEFGDIFPHLDFTLCIQSNLINDKDSIALHDSKMRELCTKLTCDNCVIKENEYIQTYPITHQDTEFGDLKVRPKSVLLTNTGASKESNKPSAPTSRIHMVEADEAYLDYRNSELIVALTNLVSTALSLRKQRQQEHQLILLEERSTIARELHDSLAQSLSYLKIQVSVLEKHLKKRTANVQQGAKQNTQKEVGTAPDDTNNTIVWQHIEQIKTGLSSAYQELRDLLTTFRLTIDSANFDEALYEAADEFAAKGRFEVKVNNQIMSLNLTATEQVHLIQIIREALSNVSRHAHAKNVVIDLGYDDESNYIAMQVIDDGIGMSGTVNQTQHHGLMIMKERAYKLGGDLIIKNNEGAETTGTCVIVKFIPSFFNDYMTEQASNMTEQADNYNN
ncbi:histidine kinase [uncultured Psychrobacter sp.]|uniref:histidine kinase n=1 Tax=uncultured Psychrobacter sp. TaxID=259303 RepID=UPI003458FAD4